MRSPSTNTVQAPQALVASLLGTRETEVIAEQIEQRGSWIEIHVDRYAIDEEIA
jgi:hypothetical protein